MAAIIAHQSHAQRIHGIVLQARVERGTHLQAAIIKRLLPVFGIELAAHFLDKIIDVLGLTAEWAIAGGQRFGFAALACSSVM